MPFLFACTFIADTASILLPVSNPINIIVTSQFPLDLGIYLKLLFLPGLVVIGVNIGVFFLLYRRQLGGTFERKRLPEPSASIKQPRYFRYTCGVLCLVSVAYIGASALRLPLSLVALGGAALLGLGALIWQRTALREARKHISWSIFGFIAGMFILVRAVEVTGLTARFGEVLLHLSGNTGFGAVMVGTGGAALGTNVINNIPMAVVLTSALRQLPHAPLLVQRGFVAASIFGCDLGPNLTTVGSLATVLWLLILRRRGIEVSGLDYFKVGIVVTPLMLLAGALAIWLLLSW
jgi:arsenical pump membrane protein